MFYSSAITDNTTKEDVRLFCQVMSLSQAVRDGADKHPHAQFLDFNCHPISRAIAKMIPRLKLVDGNFLGLITVEQEGEKRFGIQHATHSWLVTPDDAIIDAYPVGFMSVNPILVVTKGRYAPHGGNFYVPDPSVTSEISNKEVWKKTQIILNLAKGWKPD
jgi:hypothetical protein